MYKIGQKKKNKKGAEEYTEKKVPIIFGNRMLCFRKCEVNRGFEN